LEFDSNKKPYIAFIDKYEDFQSFSIIRRPTDQEKVWEKIKYPACHDISRFSFTLSKSDDMPVVAYHNKEASLITVTKMNENTGEKIWEEIGSFPITVSDSERDFPPAIIQDTDNCLVLAYSGGVKKFDDSTGEWEDLFFIDTGEGDPAYWIDSNDRMYVVAYRDEDNKICVKKKDKNKK
jgi:hypothetical protein